jgi:hypothetical protein
MTATISWSSRALVYDDGYYTITVYDYYDTETWSEWIRDFDDTGTLDL